MTGSNDRVVVIGAGVVGSAIAYFLAKAGTQATLIERSQPGSATSRASFGFINAARKEPVYYQQLSRLGIEAFADLERDLGSSLSIGHGGGLHWALDEDGRAQLKKLAPRLTELGYPFRMLTLEEAARLEPNVEVKGAGGPILHSTSELWVDGEELARSLYDRFVELGGVTLTPCSVREILQDGTRVTGVATSSGTVPADTVIVAAGTASVGLIAPLGYTVPIVKQVGVLGITSPCPGVINRVLYLGDYHVRPARDGAIAIGCHQVDLLADEHTDATAPPTWANRLLDMAREDIRGLDRAEIREIRVGVRPVPQDGLPIVGEVPGARGAYLAVMHSGVTLAAIVGRSVACEITGRRRTPVLEPYRPERKSLAEPDPLSTPPIDFKP